MATIILGQHPNALEVRLTEGDGAELVATLVDSTGAEADWATAPTLEFTSGRTSDGEVVAFVAAIDGPTASWALTKADVDAIVAASPRTAGRLETKARISSPDDGDADGHVEYAGRVKWSDGWTAGDRSQRVTFTLPGGPPGPKGEKGDKGDPGEPGSSDLGDLPARVDGFVDHEEVASEVTFSGPTASHWFSATAPTTITLEGYQEGQVVTLICFSGAEDVTVNDAGDTELVDGTAWSAMLARGAWISGGGGGEPAVPDTTPPTAITDLTATGGAGSLTFSWSARTDPESAVHYRYRYYLTSAGSSGAAWVTTDTTSHTLNVTSGAYTIEAYSYSQGGSTVADTATATVTAPAGWSEWDRHEFNAADGTSLSALPTVNGRTYSSASTAVIHDNKAAPNFYTGGTDNNTGTLALSPPVVGKMRQSIDYDNSNASIGYTCYLDASLALQQTGQVGVWLQANTNNAPTSSTISYVYATSAGVSEPPIVYESGKGATGHPVAGKLTLLADTATHRIEIYINDVLVGHIDTTAFAYGGEPNPVATTAARMQIGNRCKVDRHVVEVYS